MQLRGIRVESPCGGPKPAHIVRIMGSVGSSGVAQTAFPECYRVQARTHVNGPRREYRGELCRLSPVPSRLSPTSTNERLVSSTLSFRLVGAKKKPHPPAAPAAAASSTSAEAAVANDAKGVSAGGIGGDGGEASISAGGGDSLASLVGAMAKPPPPPAPCAPPEAPATTQSPSKSCKPPVPLPARAPAPVVAANGNDNSSDDEEIDMSKPNAAAATAATTSGGGQSPSNTVDSDADPYSGPATESQTGNPRKPKPDKKGFWPRKKDRHRGSMDLLSGFNFPQDMPEHAKALFQIPADLRKPLATAFASGRGRTDDVKKQKRLLTESSEKRFAIDGKSRSVWLDPAPGDEMEIWKEYFHAEGDCKRALARLKGTDKYGYIVSDEVDLEKKFPTNEERKDYVTHLLDLSLFGNEYGEGDDEQFI